MPVKVRTLESLKSYFKGVVAKAEHHAQNVNEIIYPLLGILFYYSDKAEFELRKMEGGQGNMLWAEFNGQRYAIVYAHSNRTIEIRVRSLQGQTVKALDNSTSIRELKEFFDSIASEA